MSVRKINNKSISNTRNRIQKTLHNNNTKTILVCAGIVIGVILISTYITLNVIDRQTDYFIIQDQCDDLVNQGFDRFLETEVISTTPDKELFRIGLKFIELDCEKYISDSTERKFDYYQDWYAGQLKKTFSLD